MRLLAPPSGRKWTPAGSVPVSQRSSGSSASWALLLLAPGELDRIAPEHQRQVARQDA